MSVSYPTKTIVIHPIEWMLSLLMMLLLMGSRSGQWQNGRVVRTTTNPWMWCTTDCHDNSIGRPTGLGSILQRRDHSQSSSSSSSSSSSWRPRVVIPITTTAMDVIHEAIDTHERKRTPRRRRRQQHFSSHSDGAVSDNTMDSGLDFRMDRSSWVASVK